MEFCGREPFDVLAIADAGDTAMMFKREVLKRALVENPEGLPHCRVPIRQGRCSIEGLGERLINRIKFGIVHWLVLQCLPLCTQSYYILLWRVLQEPCSYSPITKWCTGSSVWLTTVATRQVPPVHAEDALKGSQFCKLSISNILAESGWWFSIICVHLHGGSRMLTAKYQEKHCGTV